MKYRTYDASWSRTGYADAPQYAGQAGLTEDYPAHCRCGSPMAGCGDAQWLRIRGWASPAWADARSDYVAWCRNGHEMVKEPV